MQLHKDLSNRHRVLTTLRYLYFYSSMTNFFHHCNWVLWTMSRIEDNSAHGGSPNDLCTPTKYVSEAGNMVEYLGHNKVPDLQKLFQKSDGIPVHLKGGLMDKMLCRTTMALTIGGTLYCLMALYIAAQPRK
uniref:Uncharacterized protein n=1 Tax=Oncorhynchus tshawytscha TaxID=74940 RepID=A0AAZ3P2G8_ONCTS